MSKLCSTAVKAFLPTTTTTTHTYLDRCPNEDKCIPLYQLCDGVRDCANGTDEDICRKSLVRFGMFLIPVYMYFGVLVMLLTWYRMDSWTMSITTLVVLFSAPTPKSSGGLM